MAYLDSSKINVYPSGYRKSGYNPESFINSEGNINSLASRLAGNKSYIVDEVSGKITFVVKGYLFTANKSDIVDLFQSSLAGVIIYAHVTVQSIPTTVGTVTSYYDTLVPYNTLSVALLDNNENKFTGVYFDMSVGADTYALALYKRISKTEGNPATDWELVESSKIIFNSSQIQDGTNKKNISEEFHSDSLISDSLKTDSIVGVKSVSADADGKLVSTNLTTNDIPIPNAPTGYYEFPFVGNASQDAVGKISTTKNCITFLGNNTTQGQFTVGYLTNTQHNTYSFKLKNLEETGVPTFSGIKLNGLGATKLVCTTGNNTLATLTPVTTTQGSISFTEGHISAINLSNLGTDGEPTFKNITISSLSADGTATVAVGRDATCKLVANNLQTSDPDADGTGLSFIATISQSSNGKITATKKSITLATGDSQGQLKINSTNYSISGLGTTDSPTFSTVKLNSNKIKRSNDAEITLPGSSGQLATVSWNSDTATLTIKTN